MEMIPFPSIEQYRSVIRNVKAHAQWVGKDENGDAIYDPSKPLPTLTFEGTVKLHGTNSAVVYHLESDTISYQSRSRILSLERDNAGFMLAMKKCEDEWFRYFHDTVKINPGLVTCAVFGEWCGKGIQKSVGISEVDKRFVIFAVKDYYDDGKSFWLSDLTGAEYEDASQYVKDTIFYIDEFPTYSIDIDFSRPELVQNKLVELTEAVENECPVAKAFGIDNGLGEGIVWRCVTPGWESSKFWMKTKGEKHSVSKVKTLNAVDVEAIAGIHNFVDSVVTENRLEQGLDNLVREQMKPIEMKSMGDFIRWVFNDILKEEQDTIIANQIDPKKLGGPIANKARPWYIKKLNESAMV